MDIKISEEKIEKLKDIIISSLDIDKDSLIRAFQVRMNGKKIQFVTPGTRKHVIAEYYGFDTKKFIKVSDDYFYDLISPIFGSRKIYNAIRKDLIKRIFKIYTSKYPSIYGDKEIEDVIFLERAIE
jgi:hypothetical protein